MRTNKNLSGRNISGFTIIELLVVIGIIALLISILLPALSRAKQSARDTLCASNQRQVAMALLIYANTNNGRLPQAYTAATPTVIAIPWHIQIWQTVMRTQFSMADITGGGNYSYLAHTPFECPTADRGQYISPSVAPWFNVDGYNNADHRNNGYALNIDPPGTILNSWTTSAQNEGPQITESKRFYAIRHPSECMLIADATGFYVEYYDRGDTLLYMNAGFSAGGGMHHALGRHGRFKDAWNVTFYDGSVRLMRFAEVPGAPISPINYYNVAAELNPMQLLTNPSVSSACKRFWLGQDN